MLTIKADIAAAERLLSDIGRKQLPFATALALNDTAADVKEVEERSIESTFDRPTPYTKRSIYVKRASKTRQTARVGVKNIQAEYLSRQVEGGTRQPNGAALVVPAQIRLNQYGNIPRRALQRLKGRTDVFITSKRSSRENHLPPGVYRRKRGKAGGLKMEIAFEGQASYRSRWKFHDIARRKAQASFKPAFFRRLKAAIATAR